MTSRSTFITLFLSLSLLSLFACQSTTEPVIDNQRATLADLANEQQAKNLTAKPKKENAEAVVIEENSIAMSKAQRSAKLAALYKNILTLEPNNEVRAKIEYRLVQIGTQRFEQREMDGLNELSENNEISAVNVNSATQFQSLSKENKQKPSERALAELVASYQKLLKNFPNRAENEEVRYLLAKALDLQGKLDKSLIQIEILLNQYPDTKYAAELHFRQGDIYYNLQHYTKALHAYQAVLEASNHQTKSNQTYYINSIYMSAWTLFKLNRLPEADSQFITLLDHIVSLEKVQPYEDSFSFAKLDKRYVSLVSDIQRVLSISLSQQEQASSLVALLKEKQSLKYLYLYQHILFKNLAVFLIENELKYDAELTYQAYIQLAPTSLWSARYSLELMALYQQQGKYNAIRELKVQYVQQYGLSSDFWQQGLKARPAAVINKDLLMTEVLPNLLSFSYQHSRYLYAQAQSLAIDSNKQNINKQLENSHAQEKIAAYSKAAHWLSIYLSLAKQPQAQLLVNKLENSQGLLADEFLYADASFEAQHYQQALNSYEYIAYQATNNEQEKNTRLKQTKYEDKLRQEAAYAATLTAREMLAQIGANSINTNQINKDKNRQQKDLLTALLVTRNRLDKAYIEHYPNDEKSLNLAVKQAQYAFSNKNHQTLNYFSNFILTRHGVLLAKSDSKSHIKANKLSPQALKHVQIASQLQANDLYRQAQTLPNLYSQAESSYLLALDFVNEKSSLWQEMRELLAACIYFQGKALTNEQPLLAVKHYLRLGEQVPESRYRLNAQFDAANLLLAQKQWQQGVDVLLDFQQRYPKHEYSRSIPAKLAQSYEQLQQWQMAAEQYLVIVNTAPQSNELSTLQQKELAREAQYSAAELYLKAGNLTKAITTFRTYAHTYPEPFAIAQEVRFKMSRFYQQTKEPNKEYYWYRKLIKYHDLFNASASSSLPSFDMQRVSERSTYLASIAALALGEAHQQTFKYTKLTLPLKKSLTRKQKAMKQAISYYQKLLSYQLAEFVPHGTFNLAQMYRQLASDVMASQRPKNLDELALEEYELLLEEIADPFEEKAIEIHESNTQRAWQNIYDLWVEKSFSALAELSPAMYQRQTTGGATHAIRTLH